MPEEINRVVADILSFGVPSVPAHWEVALEFGFEFDGIRAIEPLGFLEFLQLEAGDGGCGGECPDGS
jgi:hypothetical protein